MTQPEQQEINVQHPDRRHILKAAIALQAIGFIGFGSAATAQTPSQLAQQLLEATPSHGDRTLGAADAPVVMIEYASATCPHCAEFHTTVWPMIKAEFVDTGKVRFIFREFPLDELAVGAFMLARCVPEERYFDTIDLLFHEQPNWTKNDPKKALFAIVGKAGLNEQDAEACVRNQGLADAIVETARKASKDFGVKGTPAFFVNGVALDGHKDPAAIRGAIEAALTKK